jgi:hypothetical protein
VRVGTQIVPRKAKPAAAQELKMPGY